MPANLKQETGVLSNVFNYFNVLTRNDRMFYNGNLGHLVFLFSPDTA